MPTIYAVKIRNEKMKKIRHETTFEEDLTIVIDWVLNLIGVCLDYLDWIVYIYELYKYI